MKSDQYIKIFEGKAIEANLVKNILEENEISTIVKDDMMSQVFPLYVSSGELKPVKVYIDRSFLEKGKKLVEVYTKQFPNQDDINEKD